MRKCATPYCRNNARHHRRECATCSDRRKRHKNPMRYAYDNLRSNAKRRRKVFTITFEDFKQFCREQPYMAGKGRSGVSFTVDRERDELGYVPGNLRVRTNADNARKGKKILSYDWETGYARYI